MMWSTITQSIMSSDDDPGQHEDDQRELVIELRDSAIVVDALIPDDGPRVWVEWQENYWRVVIHASTNDPDPLSIKIVDGSDVKTIEP
jgi:hypothetical protein